MIAVRIICDITYYSKRLAIQLWIADMIVSILESITNVIPHYKHNNHTMAIGYGKCYTELVTKVNLVKLNRLLPKLKYSTVYIQKIYSTLYK